MKNLLLLFLATFLATSLLAQPEIKIGAVLPLSGDAQAFGQEARMALEHSLADFPNKKFKYKLIFENDQLSPAKASLAAKKLLDIDGAKIIFSNWSYGGNAVASTLKNKPAINLAFAWDQQILAVADNNFIISGAPERLAKAIIQKIQAEGGKSIILIGFQEAGVEFSFNALEAYAKENGISVLKRIETNPAEIADYRSLLTQAKSLKPDYLVTCLIYPQMLELFKQMKILKVDLPVSSIGQAPFAPEFKTILPKVWWSVDYQANVQDYQKIRERTGLQDFSGYPSYYEALRAILTIMERAPLDAIPTIEKIREDLASYQQESSLLGKIYYQNRHLQSENVGLVDQLIRYKPN